MRHKPRSELTLNNRLKSFEQKGYTERLQRMYERAMKEVEKEIRYEYPRQC